VASVSTAKSGSFAYPSFQVFPYDTSAAASSRIGTIHLNSISSGSTATQFSGSQATAGWNDAVEIVGPAGQKGVWLFALTLDGSLSSTGPGADSQAGLIALQNHSIHQPYGDALHASA
jgi:chitodextrinase